MVCRELLDGVSVMWYAGIRQTQTDTHGKSWHGCDSVESRLTNEFTGDKLMAKHIHRFYKQDTHSNKSKYMWKCSECGWFVHAGLEHVMIGMSACCWTCGDTFTVIQTTLSQDNPKCLECLGGNDLDSFMKHLQEKHITKKVGDDEIEIIEPVTEVRKDKKKEIEVIEDCAPDCPSWSGGDCLCK